QPRRRRHARRAGRRDYRPRARPHPPPRIHAYRGRRGRMTATVHHLHLARANAARRSTTLVDANPLPVPPPHTLRVRFRYTPPRTLRVRFRDTPPPLRAIPTPLRIDTRAAQRQAAAHARTHQRIRAQGRAGIARRIGSAALALGQLLVGWSVMALFGLALGLWLRP